MVGLLTLGRPSMRLGALSVCCRGCWRCNLRKSSTFALGVRALRDPSVGLFGLRLCCRVCSRCLSWGTTACASFGRRRSARGGVWHPLALAPQHIPKARPGVSERLGMSQGRIWSSWGIPRSFTELVEIPGMLQEALGGVQAQNALECPKDVSGRPGEFPGASRS